MEKFYYIFSKESFSYISRNGPFNFQPKSKKKKKKKKKGTTLRKLLTLQETEAPKKAFIVFQETSYISGSNFLWLKIKIFHALPHVEAKLSRLKYFFIIIIKHFFSFCNTFFYTQQSFAFHLLRAFYNIHDHIMAFFSFSSFEKF